MNRNDEAIRFAEKIVCEELEETGISMSDLRNINSGRKNNTNSDIVKCRDWVIKRMNDEGFNGNEIGFALNRGASAVYDRLKKIKEASIDRPSRKIGDGRRHSESVGYLKGFRKKSFWEQPDHIIKRRFMVMAQRAAERVDFLETEEEKRMYANAIYEALIFGLKCEREKRR